MAKSSHYEDWSMKEIRREAERLGVQHRRFTNKKNLIHRMRETYWATQQEGGGSGGTRGRGSV